MRGTGALLSLSILAALMGNAWANLTPKGMLQQVFRQVLAAQKNSDQALKRKKAVDFVQRYADFETFSLWALTDHWENLSSPQQKRFIELFQRRFTENLIESFLEAKPSPFSFRVVDVEKKADHVEVTCHLIQEGRTNDIVFKLTPHQGSWRVFNVAVKGADLVSNYQGQFNKIIRDSGFDEVLRRLERNELN